MPLETLHSARIILYHKLSSHKLFKIIGYEPQLNYEYENKYY